MAVGRMESESWWMIFIRDISILSAFSSRCSSVSLARTTVQGFSGCNEAKSSMHSGEEPGDELTHLDEEEANSNYSVHELRRIHVVCSKVLQQQRCRTCTPACTTTCATNFASYLQTAKKKRKKKENNCIASTFVTVTTLCKSTWWIISSSCDWCKLLLHQGVSIHCLGLLNTWKMMLCHS